MPCLALVAALGSAAAQAEERPLLRPTRDVDITYRASYGHQNFDQRWRYRAGEQKLRLDLPAQGNYMIADQRAHTAAMVSDGARQVLDVPLPPTDPAGLRPGQGFARLGAATVAGVGCTEWRTTDSRGSETIACLTADGVLLRARHGEQVVVEATRVSYGPLDEAAFTVPPGYRHESAPAQR